MLAQPPIPPLADSPGVGEAAFAQATAKLAGPGPNGAPFLMAAQSEELRVQRAAIARTQRALRTMSRGDEEKATEPALRDDTQAKTRINV